MWREVALAAVVGMLLGSAPARAGDVPNFLTSQGVVRNEAGDVVNGAYKLTFKLYTAQTGGQVLWTEVVPGVAIEYGVYNVVLGKVTPLPASLFKDNATAWLGIAVESEAELPRIEVTSVPYALAARNALLADKAADVECAGCIDPANLAFDPVTQQELNTGDLTVKGTVKAAKFIGDGSGLTGISSPQGTCADGWVVKAITAEGKLVCEKAATAVSSVNGLGGGTINGDVEVNGVLTMKGAEVCTDDANCGEELWQLACQKNQVPRWDGAMWTCGDLKVDTSSLPADGINEVSNNLIYNQFTDTYSSPSCPKPIPDNNPTGVDDVITVPDAGIAQDLTISVNITNSNISQIEVWLFDPQNTKYVLYSKGGAGTQLGTTYPSPTLPVSGDLSAWIGKNPQGTWHLLVIDTGYLNNATDGQINSWSIQVKTLSSKKIQVKGSLVVDGGLSFSGSATIAGSLKIGPDNGKCDESKRGTLRLQGTVVQFCNGSNWTFIGSNATYRWTVFSTYGEAHGQWYAGNDPNMFGGEYPSHWTDNDARAYEMSADSDILRTIFTRTGPPIGTLKNAVIYADEWYYNSSTNGKVVLALFRIRNKTAADLTWKVYWYRTAYAGWSERASIAINGSEVWQSGGANYGPHQNSSHDITIPKNRTSTVIFHVTSSSPGGTRSCFMAFYSNCLVLPEGLEYVDDLDTKPSGWDN